MLERHLKSRHKEGTKRDWRKIGALAAFGLIVVLGPLAFGAVDRVVQTGLVLLIALGVFLYPPATMPLGKQANIVVISLIAIFVLKEFLPHQWFGPVRWRGKAESGLGLILAGTHHPEPARAFDALLIGLVAIVWLQWVRTMAAQREMRVALAWILATAGVVLAAVCFVMSSKGGAIYGIRHAPGWTGWGPFPNRNHTASLLAMSAMAGLGCTVWAGVHGRKKLAIFGAAGVFLVMVALLVGKSRGGLVALAAGSATFCGMILWKHRDRRTIAIVVAGVAAMAVVVAVFGGQALERLFSEEGKHVSNQLRKDIWSNAIVMWRDAPLLGHGAQTFAWLFPFYQKLTLDDNVVLHPESSVLQWLCELGLLPLAILVVLIGGLVASRLPGLFKRRGIFYLSGGALAGVVAMLVHSLIDVPGHRWGTAGFALAMLGLACPMAREVQLVGARLPGAVLLPLAVGTFWALPFLGLGPAWQPVSVEQLQAREASGRPPRPGLEEWRKALQYFPLHRELHHFAAMRELDDGIPKTSEWQRHIEAVHGLTPGGWRYPISHARAVKRLSPALCIQYWQVAIARSGWRRTEILGQALDDTTALPGAEESWARYVASNPRLALAYARRLPEEQTRPFFELWWKECGGAMDLSADETRDFYNYAKQWATGKQILEWMTLHPTRRKVDFREWAALLHKAGMSERAWQLCQGRIADPSYPGNSRRVSREEVEARIRLAPENTTNLVELADISEETGDRDTARKIVLDVAAKPDAPSWFLRKAAHLLAADGSFSEAMEMLLRDK